MEERSSLVQSIPSISPVQFEEIDATLHQLRELRKRLDDAERRFTRVDEQIDGLDRKTSELRQTCVEVAKSAHLSVQLAEDLFGAHAAAIDRKMAEWSDKIQGTVVRALEDGSARTGTGIESSKGLPAAVTPWALEGVAELHHSIRDGSPGASDALPPDAMLTSPGGAVAPHASVGGTAPVGTQFPVVTQRAASPTPENAVTSGTPLVPPGSWQVATILVVALAAGLGLYNWRLRDRLGLIEARSRAAETRIAQAEREAGDARLASARQLEASARQIEAAERRALRAQAVADVLAAPDLVRFDLRGTPLARSAYAQVLWSRSRGLVLSASRLPSVAPGRMYQAWVLSGGQPRSAGLFAADENGRGGIVIERALTFPKPVALSVTSEAREGATRPTGRVYLTTEQ